MRRSLDWNDSRPFVLAGIDNYCAWRRWGYSRRVALRWVWDLFRSRRDVRNAGKLSR